MLSHKYKSHSVYQQAPSQEAVMLQFQQVMLQMTQNFLSTQQAVMLCYLRERPDAPFIPAASLRQQPLTLSTPAPQLPLLFEQPAESFGINQQALTDNEDETLQAAENEVLPETSELIEASSEVAIEAVTEIAPDLSDQSLIAALLELISERTGYPIDMIEPGLDLESDLGIDSIKRIEILNKLQSFLSPTRRAEMESSLEELASARTVNQIVDLITKKESLLLPETP